MTINTYIHTYVPPEGHQIGAREEAHRVDIIVIQLNRVNSQLAASIDGEPRPTPAGNNVLEEMLALFGIFGLRETRRSGQSALIQAGHVVYYSGECCDGDA